MFCKGFRYTVVKFSLSYTRYNVHYIYNVTQICRHENIFFLICIHFVVLVVTFLNNLLDMIGTSARRLIRCVQYFVRYDYNSYIS